MSSDIVSTEKITSVWETLFPTTKFVHKQKHKAKHKQKHKHYVNFTETYYKFYNNSQSATTSDKELFHFGALTQVCDSLLSVIPLSYLLATKHMML